MDKEIEKFNKFSNAINTINKYFSYLRKKRRGDLWELLDKQEIENFENIDKKTIDELIRENMLTKDYLCTICHQAYETIEMYYEKLPFITLNSDTDSFFITLSCDGCREEVIKKIFERFKVLNDVYMEKKMTIKEESDIMTVAIIDKFGVTLGSIIILKEEWNKIKNINGKNENR